MRYFVHQRNKPKAMPSILPRTGKHIHVTHQHILCSKSSPQTSNNNNFGKSHKIVLARLFSSYCNAELLTYVLLEIEFLTAGNINNLP